MNIYIYSELYCYLEIISYDINFEGYHIRRGTSFIFTSSIIFISQCRYLSLTNSMINYWRCPNIPNIFLSIVRLLFSEHALGEVLLLHCLADVTNKHVKFHIKWTKNHAQICNFQFWMCCIPYSICIWYMIKLFSD